MYRPNLKCDVHLGLITYGELRPPHSYTIGGTGGTSVCIGVIFTIQRLDPPHLSTLDCCRSWSPSALSAGSYVCLVIVAPICYAHVVSDDRSHSSYVVDRPTASACSSPTTNCSCELSLHLCEYYLSATRCAGHSSPR
ncbi:hypothetical protein B0H14DRAFT_2856710 [Mycena olivaceomarginata]|nr:hypothetical protein B0H14DRAFT_2856710 [Mycena olivaceomarginata]